MHRNFAVTARSSEVGGGKVPPCSEVSPTGLTPRYAWIRLQPKPRDSVSPSVRKRWTKINRSEEEVDRTKRVLVLPDEVCVCEWRLSSSLRDSMRDVTVVE